MKKDLFDCSKIGDFYDCGCADEDGKEKGRGETKTTAAAATEGGRIDLRVQREG